MALTTKTPGTISPPSDLTEAAPGAATVPNNLTEQTPGAPAIPNNLAEATPGSVAIPNNLTEQSAGSVAIPNNLTEQSVGSVAIPNNLTEQAVGTIPRTLDPILKLDFENEVYETTSNQGLDDIVTYTRNSSASFWNRRQDEQGRWETFLDTDYVGSVTNLLTYSEDFSNADWIKTRASFSNGQLIEDTTPSNTHFIYQLATVTASTTYTFSIRLKQGGRKKVRIQENNSAIFQADVDLLNGVVTTTSGVWSIHYDNGTSEYVISATSTTGGAQTSAILAVYLIDDASATSYTGDGVSGVYISQAQLTQSAKPLPYVKTEASSASETFVEQPRLEYDPITAEPLGYLAEGASTNLITSSEDLGNADWGSSALITENQEIAPDGTKSMDEIASTGTSSAIAQTMNLSLSTDYTVSCYVKNKDSGRSRLDLYDTTSTDWLGILEFNWVGGVPETQSTSGVVNNIKYDDCKNGTYRVSFQTTSDDVNATHAVYIYADRTGGNGSIYAWGAQLEELPFASSYIRTEGATVQRNDDDMSAPVAETEIFSVSYEAKHLGFDASTSIYTFALSDGTSANRLLSTVRAGDGLIQHTHVKDSVAISDQSTKSFIDQYRKNTLTQDYDGFSIYIDDELEYNNTGLQPFKVNALQVASRQDNTALYDGYVRIKNINIYEQSLTASEVALGDSLSGITEAVIPALSPPNDLTEQAVGAVAIPNNLTEQTAGSVAIPNDLTEQTVSAFPRTFAPLLNLDFANEIYATNDEPSALDDIVTYTRNSSASFWNRRIGRNGKYETFLDTDYVGSVTNLLNYSEDITQSDWTVSAGTQTITTDGTKTPDGVVAYLVDDQDGTLDRTYVQQSITVANDSVNRNGSIYVKAGTAERCQLGLFYTGGTTVSGALYFNANTGAVTNATGSAVGVFSNVKSEYISDGWYRISFELVNNSSGNTTLIFRLYPATQESGKTGSTYISKAQLTQSIKQLPYVKTLSTSASETFVESPRLEYDPITAQPLGYLAEGASTNLQIWSEEFDNVAYTKTGGAITANDTVAPDGTKSADLFTLDSSTGNHSIADAITFTNTESYTHSLFIKWNPSNTITQLRVAAGNAGILPVDVRYNFSTLTVTETSGSGKITDYGNGWYRIETTSTAISSGVTNVNLNMFDGASNNFTGNGTDSFHLWGWQVENLPFASSYIPTLSGSTEQRVVDAMYASPYYVEDTNIGGSIYYEADIIGRMIQLSGTNQNVFTVEGAGFISGRMVDNNNTQPTAQYGDSVSIISTGADAVPFVSEKFVLTLVPNVIATMYRNGALEAVDTTIAPAPSRGTSLAIGSASASGSQPLNGHVKQIITYSETLTAQEVSLL